ncbi:MAG: PAAR domain-containing protein [Actinobacteria bacterium]|nr:PAAR domain-containing protein [Actinomycetota bacterium]
MPPAARIGDVTATGDTIIPLPGVPPARVIVLNQPAACAGDLVSGPACVGAIEKGSATVFIGGRPAVRVGDTVTGTNPASGAPVKTAIGPPGALTVQIGG